jgi:hypothetical protein
MAIDRAKKPEEIDVDDVLTELESKVERLKILYEQYFMGIEKIEPQTVRKEITRKILELSQLNMRNTAQRYRFNALHQKFGVYSTYWSRTLREIENGTYFRSLARAGREAVRRGLDVPDEVLKTMPKRLRDRILKDRERIAAADKMRAERQAARSTQPPAAPPAGPPAGGTTSAPPVAAGSAPDKDDFDPTFDALFDSLSVGGSKKSTPPPAGSSRPPAPPALPPGMDETKMRDLYNRFVQARRAVGATGELKYEQLVATVARQGPKILEQHKAREVEFNVVIKEGKVILKATPKR